MPHGLYQPFVCLFRFTLHLTLRAERAALPFGFLFVQLMEAPGDVRVFIADPGSFHAGSRFGSLCCDPHKTIVSVE